jgi:S-adenosylhomocysteine hydrolase
VPPRLHTAPRSIDEDAARRALAAWNVRIDALTEAQRKYIYG